MTLLKVPPLSISSGTDKQQLVPYPVASDTPMTFVTNNTRLDQTVEVDSRTAQGTLGTDAFQQAVDFEPPAQPSQLIDPTTSPQDFLDESTIPTTSTC